MYYRRTTQCNKIMKTTKSSGILEPARTYLHVLIYLHGLTILHPLMISLDCFMLVSGSEEKLELLNSSVVSVHDCTLKLGAERKLETLYSSLILSISCLVLVPGIERKQ